MEKKMSNNYAFVNALPLVINVARVDLDQAFQEGIESFIALLFDECQEGAYKIKNIEVDKKDYVYPEYALASKNVSPSLLIAFQLEKESVKEKNDALMIAIYLKPGVSSARVFSLENSDKYLSEDGKDVYAVFEVDCNNNHESFGPLDNPTIEEFLKKLETIVK